MPAAHTDTRTAGRQIALWAPVAVWMGVIFAASSMPGSSLPGGYSFQGHLTEYAVLGALGLLALRDRALRPVLGVAVVVACSLYGVTDEFHQAFVPGRTPDVMDWATDTAGATIGSLAAYGWLTWRARTASRRSGSAT